MECYLKNIRSRNDLKELFIEEWNWKNPESTSMSIDFSDETKGKIEHFEILAEKLYCKILLFTLQDIAQPEKELRQLERKILATPEIKRMAGDTVFIFSFSNFDYLDFVRAEQVGTKLRIKRFSVSPDNRDKLRTPEEQLRNLSLPADIQLKPSSVRERIEDAFKVEVLTEQFYTGYIAVFKRIKEYLLKQDVRKVEEKEKKLKDSIHQVLNRMMFLIQKKQYVYESGSSKDCEHTLYLEKRLLLDAITEEERNLQKEVQKVGAELSRSAGFQEDLYKKEAEQKTLFEQGLRKKKEFLENDLFQVKKYREELRKLKEPPMIWDLAFAEVFMMKNGFDIVIANPPYVRQEEISDLDGFYSSKSEYKEKLIEQIKTDWQYDYSGAPLHCPQIQIDKKSDLYIYFYLKGLKLLNENGILCYISSNSWLDVGYGKDLQEILLKRVPVIAIYDNQAKIRKQTKRKLSSFS